MMDGNDMGGGRKMGAEARLGTQHVRSAGKRSGLHDESHGVLVSSVDVTDGNVHGHRPPRVNCCWPCMHARTSTRWRHHCLSAFTRDVQAFTAGSSYRGRVAPSISVLTAACPVTCASASHRIAFPMTAH
ncbi:unnamed protein product [Urochloa humidicola]